MMGIRCMVVCGWHSEDSFVSFGAKPTQWTRAQDLSRDRK